MKILIVGCLHGDERFGSEVVEYCLQKGYQDVNCVLANKLAFDKNTRFIDQDLNRSFPGDTAGNYEQRRAHELMPIIESADIVLDIHTTTSDIRMVPIVADTTPRVREVLHYSNARDIVVMGDAAIKHSLIGHARTGISLEFGLKYAQNQRALQDVVEIIEGLIEQPKQPKKMRRIFHVAGKISLETDLPEDAQNFEYVRDHNLYPFLLHEKSYKDFQGFYADSYEEAEI
ncbi:succinylglutamate desuccinylase/aspartoacylase family protein [Candidatus Saccharibacteria bacterium]|nr:succinylglutamate desuccinylase/aspartoacylase family protein [Candidatus Saccharibacteria bacterium]